MYLLQRNNFIRNYSSNSIFRFEWQKAKITVSELKCDPYEEQTLEDRIDQIEFELANVKSQISFSSHDAFQISSPSHDALGSKIDQGNLLN